MNEKQRFFLLGTGDRQRIGYLVASISVVHIIQFALAPPATVLSRGGGIVLNAIAALWSIRPESAPRFWFGLLPYVWCLTAIFDGMETFRAMQDGQVMAFTTLLAVVNLLLLPFLAPSLLRFYQTPRDSFGTPE